MDTGLIEQFRGMSERGTEGIFDLMLEGVTLMPEQKDAVLECYTRTDLKGVLTMEMGTGKTYVCMGLAQIARCLDSSKKGVISVPKNKVEDFKNLIEESLQCNVMVVSGQKPSIDRLAKNFDKVDIIVAQHSFWTHSIHSLMFMYNNVDKFNFSFYDEADGKNAIGFKAFIEFSRLIPISFLANATPIGKDTTLIRHLLYATDATNLSEREFDNRYCDKTFYQGTVTSVVNVPSIKQDFRQHLINLNRSDIGLKAENNIKFHPMRMSGVQQTWVRQGLRKDIALYSPEVSESANLNINPKPVFSPRFVPALAKMNELLNTKQDMKKIIYVKNTDTIIKLRVLLDAMGYNPYIIDGQHTRTAEMQKASEEKYNADSNGIMITNIIKGTNLDTAQHVIIYDTPPDVQQLIFRAIRGIKSKTIEVDWIYYPQEEQGQIEDALEKTKNVADLLGREVDIIPQLEAELRKIKGRML